MMAMARPTKCRKIRPFVRVTERNIGYRAEVGSKLFLSCGCEYLKLDVTFMGAGPEFVGVNRCGNPPRLARNYTPHVSLQKPGAEKIKTRLMLSVPTFFEAYPRSEPGRRPCLRHAGRIPCRLR